MVDGLLLVDKQAGCTSHDVVQQVRRLMRQRRIGHCGTLDRTRPALLTLVRPPGSPFLIRARARRPAPGWGSPPTPTAPDGRLPSGHRRVESHLRPGDAGVRRQLRSGATSYCAKKIGEKYYEPRGGQGAPTSRGGGDRAGPPAHRRRRLAFRLACESGIRRSLVHDLGDGSAAGPISVLRRTRSDRSPSTPSRWRRSASAGRRQPRSDRPGCRSTRSPAVADGRRRARSGGSSTANDPHRQLDGGRGLVGLPTAGRHSRSERRQRSGAADGRHPAESSSRHPRCASIQGL